MARDATGGTIADSDAVAENSDAMPELRHLRYFIAVAQELSFSRAAERLHMAQSPLSAAIRQLETELGVPLFERTTRSVRLTPAGERLLERGLPALTAVDGAFAGAMQAGRGLSGTLRIGSSPAARHELRPALLARVREALPDVEIELSEATSGTLIRELLGERLDVALLFCSDPLPGLQRRRLSDDGVHVLMRSSHRLAGWETVRIDALRGDRFVVPGEDLNGGFHRRLRALCDFEPATVVAGVIWDEAEWPAGDDVVTLTTERWARHIPPSLRAPRLEPAESMPVDLAWRERDASPLLGRFLGLAGLVCA
jgi:DNA-binding transcriptional LysR family regulator